MSAATRELLTWLGIAAALLLVNAAVPPVPCHADPGCLDSSDPTCGGHSWNGPLRQTWDTPGYYGGQYDGPELCSPFSYECGATIPTQ